ncbi:SDR family NAD(P)-dependent oxidoreductase [Defluviimonas salinarum]|uniref:SDR family NAD(P)-dependent oxidoreductase n=1 Tax=Defluviimonas salinarum TaxID=2992147 RepID=A0ABT3J0K9_9RHOB|nr:SDR family NAD(P)-dependent oxidoreductase [Defluviimonas salinarum]MCW3781218.1 SDR family NAD(P)-dependent oxidoreductase [Defluviimonas salinarum]
MTKPVCAILGVGPGNGMACARRFSEGGYALGLCSRRGPDAAALASVSDAHGYACDVTDPASLDAALAAIRADLGPIETLVFNAGSAHWGDIDALDADALRRDVEVNAVGLFLAAKGVLPGMRELGRGNIVVIGAGAALRGRPGTIAFAAGKAAQRSVAQSLARQLGPENIHVAYLVLDGVVDLATTKARMPDKPETFFLSAEGVAEAAFAVTRQDRQAWSFELDLRPFGESW